MSRCKEAGPGILMLVSVWGMLLLQEPVKAQPKQAITLATIEKAWKDRQSKFQGLWVKWKEKRHFPRGFYSAELKLIRPELLEQKGLKEAIFPLRDTEVEFVSALTFDGRRARYHTATPSFEFGKAAHVAVPRIYVSIGEKDLVLTRDSRDLRPQGLIGGPLAHLHPNDPHLIPILCHIRPCDRTWTGIRLEKHTLTSRQLLIDGAWCIELEQMGRPGRGPPQRHWLDPKKGFLLTRTVMLSKGKVSWQQDIRYASDPVVGWMPASWSTVFTSLDGKSHKTERVEVLAYSLNPTIPDSQFSLTFPPGTMVSDQLNKTTYEVAGKPSPVGFPALLEADSDTADPFAGEAVSESPLSGWSIRQGVGLGFACVAIVLIAYILYSKVPLKRRSS